MINIVKDMTKLYTSNEKNIKVKNIDTYLLARKFFIEIYSNGENGEIIIQNKRFFNFFLDFEEYSNIEVKEISEIKEIKDECYLKEKIKDFSLFSILLFLKRDKALNKKEIVSLCLKEYPEWLINKILQIDIEKVIQFLVNGVIFSNYKSYNFYSLMDAQDEIYDFFKENLELKNSFEKNKDDLLEFIKKTNIILSENKVKLEIFMNFEPKVYLKEISGLLSFEKEFFIKNFLFYINKSRDFKLLKESLNEYSKVFKEDITNIETILVDFEEILKLESLEIKNIDMWKDYYIDRYLRIEGCFYYNTFFEKIKELEKLYFISLFELRTVVENIIEGISKRFEQFYIENYHYLYSSEYKKNLAYSLNEAKEKFYTTKKQIIIFIDCLRYDIWLKLKEYFETKGFYVQGEDLILSSIPTLTSYCKKVLYYGKKYNLIENNDYQFGLQELFPEKEILKLQERSQFDELITNDKLFLYEIIDLDNLFHETKDIPKDFLAETLIGLRLNDLLKNINPEEYSIILMTDHGAKKLKKDEKFNFNLRTYLQEKGLECEVQGRSIKIYGDFYNKELYETVKERLGEEKYYHVIPREKFSEFYLPITERGCENYFLLLNKFSSGPSGAGDFTHGGISLEEVMIPFAVLSNKQKSYEKITISILSDNLIENKIKDIEILIKNNNELKNIKCYLKTYNIYQLNEIKFLEWKGNKQINIPIKLENFNSNILNDNLIIEFEIENIKMQEVFPIVLKVEKEQIKDILNKKLRNSRSLL
ncbi:hypothetical protein [Fusobacterium sp. SYSU M8A802]